MKTEETPIGAGVEPAADAAPAADDDDEDVEEPPPDEQTLEFFRDIWYGVGRVSPSFVCV